MGYHFDEDVETLGWIIMVAIFGCGFAGGFLTGWLI